MFRSIILCTWFFIASVSIAWAQNTLEDYLKAAIENSPLIHDNKNMAEVNQLEAERLRAFYNKPQISLTGNYLFAPIVSTDNNETTFEANPNGTNQYYGYDLAATNGGVYQGLINFSQPLYNGGKAYEEQAEITAEVNRNTARLSTHDLEKLVTDQYIFCLQDKNQIAFADSTLMLLEDQTALVKLMVESGLLKQSDLALVKIELQNYRAIKTTNEATYKRDLLQLNVLSGIQDTSYVMIEDIELNLTKQETNAGFLSKYILDSLSLLATQKVFEVKYKPQLNLIADAGLNAVYAPTIPNRFGLSAGLSFTWNIFDGRQKPIAQKKTNIQLETVSFYKENFLKQNEVRKTSILNELASYDNRLTIAENQLAEYETLLTTYRKEIIQGQLSIIDYITTLKNRSMVKRDYILLQTNRLLLINMYNYWNW